jgi:hypothetical protein
VAVNEQPVTHFGFHSCLLTLMRVVAGGRVRVSFLESQ